MSYLDWSNQICDFLFENLNIKSTGGLVGACFVVGLFTFGLEGSRVLFLYLETRIRQHPLTYGQTDGKAQDKAPLFSSLMIPSSMDVIKKRRLKYHCLAFLTHTVNVLLGFLIMLAVMSFNVWIYVSVVFGSGFGHFLFGTFRYKVHLTYPSLAPEPSTSKSSLQINALPEEAE